MKIVVVSPGPFPEKSVPLGRIHLICKALVQRGIDVEVAVAYPRKNSMNQNDTIIDGVVYRQISQRIFNVQVRIFHLIDIIICQFIVLYQVMVNQFKAQVIVVYPSFDYRLLIPLLSVFSKAKVVMEINEYPFIDRPGWLSDFKRAVLFRFFFRLYSGFIVISEELCRLVNRFKSDQSIVIKIPVVAEHAIKCSEAISPYDFPYLFHAGSLTEEKDGILGMIEAFGIARNRVGINLKYIFTGNVSGSNYSERIKEIISQYNLSDSVVFLGFLPQEQLYRHLQFCTLAIVNKYDTIQNRYCFATKLAEYLSYSIPVVTTSVGESKFYLTDGLNAYVTEPHKPQLLAEKIVEAIGNNADRQRIAAGGSELFEKSFFYMSYCDVLVDFFEQIVSLRQYKKSSI